MQNVLIIGPDFYHYNTSLKEAFETMGMTARVVSYDERLIKDIFLRNYYRILRLLGKDAERIYEDRLNRRILETYHELKPELVLVIKGTRIDRVTLKAMKGSRLVLWMMDSILRIPQALENADVFDAVFLFEKDDVDALAGRGITGHYLPLGYDESIYHPLEKEMSLMAKEIDITFVGDVYEAREVLVERLIQDFRGKKIRIYGRYLGLDRPKRYGKYLFQGRHRHFMNREVSPEEVNRIYQKSRIVLNMHHDQNRYSCNPRTFEILGSGALQVVDRKDFLVENLADGLVMYEDYEDLRKKVGEILKDPLKYEEIRRRGQSRAVESHTIRARVIRILEVLG